MSIFKRLIAAVSVLAVAGTFSLSSVPFSNENVQVSAVVDTDNDDWLHAEGSRLYDMNGSEVWLIGAN